MTKDSTFKDALKRIAAVFTGKREPKKEKTESAIAAMRLNFFLLSAAFKKVQNKPSLKPFPLFTAEIINSKNKHFDALIAQAQKVCSNQDLELFSYKAFYSENHFALRRAVQWKFAKYIKSQEEASALLAKMKNSSPEAFKRHLITLLKEEKFTSKEIGEEAKRLEKQYGLWHHGSSDKNSVSPL
ncbi:MAG: hypothetical protein KDK71_02465 [Chlamydiia bacterium]|nr:hypothetical protein [Chlamydiia bacterium]